MGISVFAAAFLIIKVACFLVCSRNLGNTALHDCAESGSLEIMRMLLRFGATMEQDGYGMTPLLSASVTGHTNIVDYLTTHQQTSHKERIDALELLGATFVDKKRDLLGALKYWKRAMDLRYLDSNHVVHKPEPKQLIMAYDYAREVTNGEELDGLISDPDEMRMQALLIRERILGPQHPDTSYYIRYRGAQTNLDPLSPMTASSLLSFAELFSFMLQDRAKGLLGTSVSFEDLMGILSKSVLEIERAVRQTGPVPPEPAQLTKALSIILHLICLLEKVPCSTEQDHYKKETIYSPLHIAASNGHPDIMNLLISSGTHFDSTNAFQQTAMDLLDEKEQARNAIQPINHTTLACLAARVIVKHSLRYRGNIPEKLEAFVLLHR
ncbi:hypothetical protein WMY93_004094 [Mugilogobius chulae]|uniref:Uncharacterized protein n=1 Tax=Mugilogobius chulae TaxID=88201 RepID=A0AAW0PRD7_9GOBI